MTTYLVTATSPTPHGDLHVGHLAGPYLAADVFSRFQRMQGNESVYLSSSAGHQSRVVTTAQQLDRDPLELATTSSKTMQATLVAAEIHADRFADDLDDGHRRSVQEFVRLLHHRGIVVPETHEIFRCRRCRRHLVESLVRGRCPYCDERAEGNLCRACGRVYDPVRLVDPVCTACGEAPSIVTYEGLFLPLERYRAQLEEFYATRTTWRPHLRALCRSLLTEPLVDYPVTYPAAWGIPVPVAGFAGQVVNPWVATYPGQVHTTRLWAASQGDPDRADRLWAGGATLVQFLGYDNSFCNGVLHVALASALDGAMLLPEHVVTNEMYFLDGKKFSTSQGHAVWGRDLLTIVEADALRYHLCRTNPEQWETNFSYPDFVCTNYEELRGTWDRAVNAMIRVAGESAVAHVGEPDLQVQGLIDWAASALERFYDVHEFSLRQASHVLLGYVEACGEYAARTHGAVAPLRAQGAGMLLYALAFFAAPVMPAFAQRLWMALGFEGAIRSQPWQGFDVARHFDVTRARDVRPDPQEWFSAVQLQPDAPGS